MRELSKRLVNIKASPLTDWDAVVKEAKKSNPIIALNAGQPDFAPPLELNESIRKFSLIRGINFYTSPEGSYEVREAISLFHKRVFEIKYTTQEIVVTNGAKEGIFASLGAMISENDEVIIIAPYWSTYVEVVKLWRGVPVIVNSSQDFHLDIKSIRKAITSKTKTIIINSPNNPTGVIYSEKELRQLAELAISNDLYIITDEIYAIIAYNENPFSVALIKGMKERTVVINGFSKVLSVTGYRIGYVAAPKDIIEAILKIKSNSNGNTNSLMQAVVTDVLSNNYSEIKEFFKEINLIFMQRKKFLCEKLSAMGIEYHEPDGAFYVFIKIPKRLQMYSVEFSDYLLNRAKVAVTPGIYFGKEYDAYVRIAFSSTEEEIEEALNNIDKALSNIKVKER
ncbi:pyridoxal phosphate-dependent aminotransferase [Patescibacteria group bacterium]|nr:pyridoxal phosphate-dependent aminotransferase [Patescibacteria group bacterium]